MNLVKPILNLVAIFIVTGACISCKTPSKEQDSEAKDFSVALPSKSIALLLGTPKLVPEAQKSMDLMASVLKDELSDQGFKVEALVASSATEVSDRIKSVAARIANNGTLLIAFAGQGTSSGSLRMEDGSSLRYAEIATAVVQGRKTPIRRTIFVLESVLSSGEKVIPPQEQLVVLNKELLGTLDWFQSAVGKEQRWSRLITDKERLANSRLSQSSEFGEVIAFASARMDETQGASGAMSVFAGAARDLHKGPYSGNVTIQNLMDTFQKQTTPSAVSTVIPAAAAKSLVFEVAPEYLAEARSKTLGLAWLNQVSKQLNESLAGCTFGPEYSVDYSSSFLFDPSFIVTSKSGQVFHDQYFGVMNWMSLPEVSAHFIIDNVLKSQSAQYIQLGCHEVPAGS